MKMRKFFIPILLGLLGVPAGMNGRENLLGASWDQTIGRPAVGSVTSESVAWRTDSILSLNVRYISASPEPAGVCSSRMAAPLSRKYRFGAMVNFTRNESWLTVRFTDGADVVYSTLVLTSDTREENHLQPGRWTRIELEADLSEAVAPENLVVELCPQWRSDRPATGNVILPILVSDPELEVAGADGRYADDLFNCTFESWTNHVDGERNPTGWKVKNGNTLPAAGSHVVDNGVMISGGATLTSPAPMTRDSVNLVFRAYSTQPATVTVKGVEQLELKVPNRWNSFNIPVGTVPESGLEFSSTADWVLDDVRLETVYDFTNPHPAEMEMTVTSTDDDGPGSLRDIVAKAPNYTLVTFAVDKVELAQPVSIGSKQLYFKGSDEVKIYAPAKGPAFTLVPALDKGLVTFNDIRFIGNASSPANGGIFTASDSRATARMHVVFDDVTFTEGNASGSGGAVYINSPGVSANFTNCLFTGCRAGNGAAVSLNNGVAFEFLNTIFTECESKSSTGGTLTVNTSSAMNVEVLGCAFDNCVSTATGGGAGAIAIQGGNPVVNIGRTLFTGCAGGRAAAVSAYNNTRGSISGRTAIVNCTAVNNTGDSPVISIASGGSYATPKVWLVNNVVTANQGKALVAPVAPSGSNNLLDNCDIEIANAITHKPNNPSFLNYKDGVPAPDINNRYVYPIHTGGALYNSGARSVVTDDGADLVTDRVLSCNSNDRTVLSVGHTEWNESNSSVNAVITDSGVCVWPNPVSTTLHIDGDFDRARISDMNGMTVYAGCSSTVDVSSIPRGVYIVTIQSDRKIRNQKIIIK